MNRDANVEVFEILEINGCNRRVVGMMVMKVGKRIISVKTDRL